MFISKLHLEEFGVSVLKHFLKDIDKRTVDIIKVFEASFLSENLFPEQPRKVDIDVRVRAHSAPHEHANEIKDSEVERALGCRVYHETVSELSHRVLVVGRRDQQVRVLGVRRQRAGLQLRRDVCEELSVGPCLSLHELAFELHLEAAERVRALRLYRPKQTAVYFS